MQDKIKQAIKQDLLRWLNSTPTEDRVSPFDDGLIVAATAQNLRDDNQDRAVYAFYESPQREREFSLLAVFDGMGGMLDGGRCAELAIASILANLATLPRAKNRIAIIEALNIANNEVFSQYGGRGGTTFAGIFVDRQGVRSVNIGDSRVYVFEPGKKLSRLSSDDRLGDQFAKIKGLEHVTLEPSIAERLGQHLGMEGQIRPNVRIIEDSVLNRCGGVVCVSTDGAHALGDEQLYETFRCSKNLKEFSAQVIQVARSNPSGDNATLICADLQGVNRTYPKNMVGFEKLTVWSPSGLFCFVVGETVQQAPPSGEALEKHSHKKWRKKKPSGIQHRSHATPDNDSSNQTASTDMSPANPKVVIEQLTFEPMTDDESAE